MEDFKLMYCILKVLLACEKNTPWNENLLSPEVLRVTLKKRNATLRRMQAEGLICGVEFDAYIGTTDEDEVSFPERPTVTMKGIEFLESNSLMKKAGKELKETAVAVASQTLASIIISKQ